MKLIQTTILCILISITSDLMAQISDTNQNQCYNTQYEIPCPKPGEAFYGQDACYQINPISFSKLDEQGRELPESASQWVMVKDNVTGLIWEVKHPSDSIPNYNNPHDADNEYSWCLNSDTSYTNNTAAFIKNLNITSFVSDWRLPDIIEMMSLFDLSIFMPTIDTTYFQHTMHSAYWTATPDNHYTQNAWAALCTYGGNHSEKKSSFNHVRAVRGQQRCSENRFIDNFDGTITDTCTGLMWQTQSSKTSKSWADALSYCEHLDHAGFSDWRLPNARELIAISDYLHYSPAIHPNYFPDTVSSYYWTSSTYARYPSFAWAVHFHNASLTYRAKQQKYDIRAVRGGQNMIPGNFVITIPKAATQWCLGENMPITWLSGGIEGNVKILISRDAGKNDTFEYISESTENEGEYTWTVSGSASHNCMIKIESLNSSDYLTIQGIFSIITNHPPTISKINDTEVKEDTTSFISFSIDDVETDPCDLTVKTHLSNNTLFSKVNIYSEDSCSDKVISITPIPDANGMSIIDITVSDQAGFQATESFQFQILPVNDCPRCSIQTYKISAPADGEVHCFNKFITNVSPGPSNESDQNVLISINTNINENTNINDIFEQLPHLSDSGDLCFKTKMTERPYSPIITTIVLEDDGNSDDGSCNIYSETVTIDITYCPLAITTENDELFENHFPTFESYFEPKKINVKCGKSPYTFTKTQGFPPQLYLSSTEGIVSGTFAETGIFYFTVNVKDETGRSDFENYSVEIVDRLKIASPTRLPSALLNEPYPKENAIQVIGGKKPYSFSLCANSSPLTDSMAFSLSTEGSIEWIPDHNGMYTFTVCVTSFDGQAVKKEFQLHVVNPIHIDSNKMYDGILSQPYEMQLQSSGGYGKHLWNADNLPDGLSLNSETGLISGKPNEAGKQRATISIIDEDGHCLFEFHDINIEETDPYLLQNQLPSGRLGDTYQQEIPVTGGFLPYTIDCYGLPNGLSWDPDNKIIKGKPTEAGTKTITIFVTDYRFSLNPSEFKFVLPITITGDIIITTPWRLDPIEVEKEISNIPLQAHGGQGPYTWSADMDLLPVGIQLSKTNELVGIPTICGEYFFNIYAHDFQNNTAQKELYLRVYSQLKVMTAVMEEAVIGETYNQRIEAQGGYGNYQWKYMGVLPQGLNFDTDTGFISGIPQAEYSAFDFYINVRDESGNIANKRLTMEVLNKEVKMIVDFIPDGYMDTYYKANIYASWGKPDYHWKIENGKLPDGLEGNTDDPFNFVIKGTPTEPGTYTFTLAVYDQSSMQKNYDKQNLSITISQIDELSIITQYLPDAILKKDENDQLLPTDYQKQIDVNYQEQIDENERQSCQFAVVKGRLPTGLNMDNKGKIWGAITKESTSEFFKIKVMVTEEKTAEKEFWIRVIPQLKINTRKFLKQIQWRDYETLLEASGGIPPYKWSLTGLLPSELKLNSITGKIMGRLIECGEFPLSLKVVDSAFNRQVDTRSIDNMNVICEGGLKELICMLQILSGFENMETNLSIGSGLDDHVGLDDVICLLRYMGL